MLYSLNNGTNTYYFLTDHQNSTQMIQDGSATTDKIYSYTPYGQASLIDSLPSLSNHFTYTGREEDNGVSGLLYYRARYYSNLQQRFISEDPIGLQGGINQYAYVDGNPVSYSDLMGLFGRLVKIWNTQGILSGSPGHAEITNPDGSIVISMGPNPASPFDAFSPQVSDYNEPGEPDEVYQVDIPDNNLNKFKQAVDKEKHKGYVVLADFLPGTNCTVAVINILNISGVPLVDLIPGLWPLPTSTPSQLAVQLEILSRQESSNVTRIK